MKQRWIRVGQRVIRSRAAGFVLVLVTALALSGAYARHKKKPARSEPPRVTPSAEIETRVRQEIAKVEHTLDNLDGDRLFDSPYLASAVYYHAGFLSSYPEDKEDADPARRIISRAVRLMSGEKKTQYLRLLAARYGPQLEQIPGGRYFQPVTWQPQTPPAAPGKGKKARRRRWRRPNHPHAIDIFTPEGTAVRSASEGVVIVAEGNWMPDDPFSTSSRLGGNTVIVVDPEGKKMFRYCHLETVLVSAGEVVQGGQKIGVVGHTGINASRPKHGGHLHFEVNEYEDGTVRSYDNKELVTFLNRAAPPAAEQASTSVANGTR